MNKKIIDLGVLGIVLLLSFVIVFVRSNTNRSFSIFPTDDRCSIQRISVISGHEYDLNLVDGRRILGHLPIQTSKDATKKVIGFLNSITNPVVTLKEKKDTYWIVEIEVSQKGDTVKMTDWLRQQKLVFE